MEVIAEMGGREETAVGAEESADEAAMTARGSEALQIIKGHGDDIPEYWSITDNVTSKHHQQQRGLFFVSTLGRSRAATVSFSNAVAWRSGKDLAAQITKLSRAGKIPRCEDVRRHGVPVQTRIKLICLRIQPILFRQCHTVNYMRLAYVNLSRLLFFL